MATIKLGSRGSEVRNIQQRLNCQVTGVYDTPTLRAVVAFQQQNGILDNGVVDTQTYDLLFPKSFVQVELESIKGYVAPPLGAATAENSPFIAAQEAEEQKRKEPKSK